MLKFKDGTELKSQHYVMIMSTKLLAESYFTYTTKVEYRKMKEDYMEWEIIHLMAPK